MKHKTYSNLSSLLASNYVRIEKQEFWMGSPESEHDRKDWEMKHLVSLGCYYICKYQVSVFDFNLFINETSYKTNADVFNQSNTCHEEKWSLKKDVNWKHGVRNGARVPKEYDHPVVHVSWNDAIKYCAWVSSKMNRNFRLPTEAEWECACRANTLSPFNTGNNLTTDQANFHGHYPYYMSGLRREGAIGDRLGEYKEDTVAIDSFPPNQWGLYNMHGNVYEWCLDWYRKEFYEECKNLTIIDNPLDDMIANERVLRGGSWWAGAKYCRSASRFGHTPEYSDSDTGFRLVIDC